MNCKQFNLNQISTIMKNQDVFLASNATTGVLSTKSTYVDAKTKETKTLYKIMVKSSNSVFNNGFLNESIRTAFVAIPEASFLRLEAKGLIVDGADITELGVPVGNIVVSETLVPHIIKSGAKKGQKQQPKRRGKDGSVMLHNGQPIYRNSAFTNDLSIEDTLLKADVAVASTDVTAPVKE